MVDRTISRREPRRLKARVALINAGLALLAQGATAPPSVDEVVERAGVAKSSFFNHFVDREGFFTALAEAIRERVEAQVALLNLDIVDPAGRMARAVCGLARFALAGPRAARVLTRSDAVAIGRSHPLNTGARADIALGLETGRFRATDPMAAFILLTGVARGLLTTIAADEHEEPAVHRLTAEVLALLLIGLGLDPDEARLVSMQAADSVIAQA